MADGTLGTGTIDAPINTGETTEKTTPESSQGTESVVSEKGTEQADSSQGPVEGGSVNGQEVRQRGPSKLDTIRELRAKIREQRGYWESEVGSLKTQLDEIRNQIASGQEGQKPRKTFFEAPEDVLGETFNSGLSNLKKELLSELRKDQMQTREQTVRAQEISEAAKFIRTQKGMTEDDIQDIRSILQDNPSLENLSPMDQAEFALYKWQKERGITDNSARKQRASTVTGAPPFGGGKRNWTESEMEAEINKLPPDPKNWTDDHKKQFDILNREFENATRQNRVSK